MTDLTARWAAACAGAGADRPEEVAAAGEALLARWHEPHRRYHNAVHLTTVLDTIDLYAAYATAPDLVRLAAWFHDAVYDPKAAGSANEEASARLAAEELPRLGLPEPAVAEVARLIRVTADHFAQPGDRDGELLCDADLTILASPEATYDAYAAAVRAEYAHVPEADFRAGRARVLRSLLDLPSIYRIPVIRSDRESAARANITLELARLHAEG